jgi:FkbM family methyltransferase
MNPVFLTLAQRLHRVPILRRCARRLAAGRTVTQSFHGGIICLDAVEHSWAWTGRRRLEDFERPLQDRLLELVRGRATLLDIGCSIGVMTLSALLRDPSVQTVSIDAAPRVIELLNTSLRRNGLLSRARTVPVAVSSGETSLSFHGAGSFTGHVATEGVSPAVRAVPLLELIEQHITRPSVIKLDVEGYEAVLSDTFRILPPRPGSILVIELHPRGFNGLGDPFRVLSALRARGDLHLELIGGGEPDSLDPTTFHQLEVRWKT